MRRGLCALPVADVAADIAHQQWGFYIAGFPHRFFHILNSQQWPVSFLGPPGLLHLFIYLFIEKGKYFKNHCKERRFLYICKEKG